MSKPYPRIQNRREISIGALLGDALVGEIHAARMPPRQFSRVLIDLRVAVHPQAQGLGVGSRLFAALFETAARLPASVTRIERVARTRYTAANRPYERRGFRAEGRFVGRVDLPDGGLADNIPMTQTADGSR